MPINSATLDEMEKFLGIHELPKLTQQVIENLSDCAAVTEIDWFFYRKAPGPDSFTNEVCYIRGKKNNGYTQKFFQKGTTLTFFVF